MSRIAGGKCRACLLVIARIVGFACNVLGQQNAADPCAQASPAGAKLPAFEVATVKPFNPKGGVAGLFVYPGGRIGAGHLNLRMLLMYACNVQTFQVVGAPGWADLDYFNIEAKPPDSSPSAQSNPPSPKFPPTDEQRQMLLALLIDRFQLKFHVESREGPVYILERGKGDLKLNPPEDVSAAPWVVEPTGRASPETMDFQVSTSQCRFSLDGWANSLDVRCSIVRAFKARLTSISKPETTIRTLS